VSISDERQLSICGTYDTGSSTDGQGLSICQSGTAEGRVEGRLRFIRQGIPDISGQHTGSTRLMTLKLSRQALIWVTVLL